MNWDLSNAGTGSSPGWVDAIFVVFSLVIMSFIAGWICRGKP